MIGPCTRAARRFGISDRVQEQTHGRRHVLILQADLVVGENHSVPDVGHTLKADGISPAAIYRTVERHKPMLLLDDLGRSALKAARSAAAPATVRRRVLAEAVQPLHAIGEDRAPFHRARPRSKHAAPSHDLFVGDGAALHAKHAVDVEKHDPPGHVIPARSRGSVGPSRTSAGPKPPPRPWRLPDTGRSRPGARRESRAGAAPGWCRHGRRAAPECAP